MNRKKLFSKIVPGLILLFLVVTRLEAQSDTLSFLHVSDIHLIFNAGMFHKDIARSRAHYANGVEPFETFLEKAPSATGASFVAVTGDLIDFYLGEIQNEKMSGFQVEQFAQMMNEKKLPVFCTLGNHDIATYSWNDGSRISSQNEAGSARASWVRNVPCFRNGTWYSHTVKAGKTTYRLIFLDNGYDTFRKNEDVTIPFISREQQHWLEAQFAESDDDVEIVLMHIPMDTEKIGKADGIYSVMGRQHSLKLVLVGHNHLNEMKEFKTAGSHFYQVQTGAFARNPENWRVIRLTEEQILVSFPGKTGSEILIPVH